MKYEIVIDKERESLLIISPERTKLIDRIEELIRSEHDELVGVSGSTVAVLEPDRISCFFALDGRVYAICEGEKYQLKLRLYQLEERYSASFVKINQSCMVNTKKIKGFEASIGGSLMVMLDDGYRDYVSRRQLKAVKERIGF